MKEYNFDTTHFRHQVEIQMRFSDLDALNHVNNGCQMQYFDVGRIHYMTDVLGKEIDWSEDFCVIVHLELDFMSSLEMGMKPYVETKIVSFGEKSMKMFQRIIDKNTGEVKSTCFSVLAGLDRKNHCSMPIPEYLKQAFTSFEEVK